MNIELINTGSELMLGRVVNSHQSWIGRELAGWGCVVTRQVAVGDSAPDIRAAVRDALGRADLVIVTGGLGPTADDLTRDVIAELLGKELREDKTMVARIEEFFAQRHRPTPPRTRVQALVPDGARVLANAHGTAPGLFMETSPNPFRPGGEKSWLVMLPGPPRELRPMFTEQLIPLLRQKLPPPRAFACRTLKTTDAPGTLVTRLASWPPVHDSAVASVRRCSISKRTTTVSSWSSFSPKMCWPMRARTICSARATVVWASPPRASRRTSTAPTCAQ